MDDYEIAALADRLEARAADSILMTDQPRQRADLRIAAIVLRRLLRDARDRADEGGHDA